MLADLIESEHADETEEFTMAAHDLVVQYRDDASGAKNLPEFTKGVASLLAVLTFPPFGNEDEFPKFYEEVYKKLIASVQ